MSESRPEYRARDGKLYAVVFRGRGKYRGSKRYVGKRSKEFKFYEKAYDMGIYNSLEARRENAKNK
ncbi:MAG TPA: hypothetical protein VMX17_15535 [Candidatus Glassbacteria bacterium]|nr:hypothetical protein [Candidatus Glassbacteria bacterium]